MSQRLICLKSLCCGSGQIRNGSGSKKVKFNHKKLRIFMISRAGSSQRRSEVFSSKLKVLYRGLIGNMLQCFIKNIPAIKNFVCIHNIVESSVGEPEPRSRNQIFSGSESRNKELRLRLQLQLRLLSIYLRL